MITRTRGARAGQLGITGIFVAGMLACLATGSRAAGLDCPDTGPGMVPAFLADSKQFMASATGADLANEIYDAVNRVQVERPNISYTELADVLIAAYCPLVAKAPQLNAAEKWSRMQRFDAILRQQIAADTMAQGSLIIANVPLPPAVYRELRSQAATVDLTPAQFMGIILAKAAGK
jgi:hypothetical protein